MNARVRRADFEKELDWFPCFTDASPHAGVSPKRAAQLVRKHVEVDEHGAIELMDGQQVYPCDQQKGLHCNDDNALGESEPTLDLCFGEAVLLNFAMDVVVLADDALLLVVTHHVRVHLHALDAERVVG